MRQLTCLCVWLLMGCDSASHSNAASGGAGSANMAGAANSTGGATASNGGATGSGGAMASNGGNGATTSAGGSAVVPVLKAGQPFDWTGIIGSGQSLSLGFQSTSISLTQPFHNLKLVDNGPDPKYPIDGSATAQWQVVPLVEPIRATVAGSGPGYDLNINQEYPNNLFLGAGMGYGETPHCGMANTLSTLWAAHGNKGDYVTAHTVVGVGGACLSAITAPDSRSFKAALSETTVYKKLADAANHSYGVGGIIFTHGECDALIHNAQYGDQVYQLQQAYDTAIKAITGQTRDVILFASQESSFDDGYTSSAVQIWQQGNQHPGKIVCTGPKYAYGPYGVHMPAGGYERMAEKYAEVFDLVVNQGKLWKPLGPNGITRAGTVITVKMDVPTPPLVWDEHVDPPHQTAHTGWASGKGFEVVDGSGAEVAIASVDLKDNAVLITLAAAPADGTQLVVGYAVTPDMTGGYNGGMPGGLHGQLRDSNTFAGYSDEVLPVQVTNGSVTAMGQVTDFARRAAFDIVSGDGVAADTIVTQVANDTVTLSAPFTGTTGTAMLKFQHDQHNFCVHFSMPAL
jgi:hypothetical protein